MHALRRQPRSHLHSAGCRLSCREGEEAARKAGYHSGDERGTADDPSGDARAAGGRVERKRKKGHRARSSEKKRSRTAGGDEGDVEVDAEAEAAQREIDALLGDGDGSDGGDDGARVGALLDDADDAV